jgi:hypothetical protein
MRTLEVDMGRLRSRRLLAMALLGTGQKRPWYLAGGIPEANCIGAYQAIGAASYAASKVNLANPGTYDLTDPAGDVAFAAATGWEGGSSKYFDTGIVLHPQNVSVLVRFTNGGHNICPFGASRATGGNRATRVTTFNLSNLTYFQNGGAISSLTETGFTGVYGVAGDKAFKNGVDLDLSLAAGSGTQIYSVFVMASNNDGAAGQFFTGKIQAVAIYNTTLTPAQVASVSTAMANLA